MDFMKKCASAQKKRALLKKQTVEFYHNNHQPVPKSIKKINIHKPLNKQEENVVFKNWPVKKIFVISIRGQRLRRCLKRLGPLSKYVVVLDYCDGRTINRKKWIKRKYIKPNCKLTSGTLGCFESHRRVWRYISHHQLASALILEDDVKLYPTSTILLKIIHGLRQIQQYSLQWDLLFLGRSHKKHQNKERLSKTIVRPGQFWGMFAYIIKYKTAVDLLQNPEINTIILPVDVVISRLGRHDHLKILAIDPPACTQIIAPSDTRDIRL
jgi:GR25 family glycosyltransferase involved in LPS biosynthesis